MFGVARLPDSAVHTGAETSKLLVRTPFESFFQAAGILTSPAPWAVVGTPSIGVAVPVSTERSAVGPASTFRDFAADSSRAAAPVTRGAAIEVPFIMP